MAQEHRSASADGKQFFFIISASQDSDAVYDICCEMTARGIPICYDDGLPSEKKGKKEIDARVRDCREVIIFVDRDFSLRQNYQLKYEYVAAQRFRKPLHIITLDDVIRGDDFSPEQVVDVLEEIIDFSPKPPTQPEPKQPQQPKQQPIVHELPAFDGKSQPKEAKPPKEKKPLSGTIKRLLAAAFVVAFLGLTGWTVFRLLTGIHKPVTTAVSLSDLVEFSGTIARAKASADPRAFQDAITISMLRYRYYKKSNYMAITGYKGNKSIKKLRIPATIMGKPVKKIDDHAFYQCEYLTDIELPDSVTVIENSTFEGCIGLKQMILPDSVKKIGDDAFSTCVNLTEIIIPSSVKMISPYTFQHCSTLTTVRLPDTLQSIGNCAFADCSALTTINFPHTLQSIGDSAFCNCRKLSVIRLPDSVAEIGSCAFSGCSSLRDFRIPSKITELYYGLFSYSGLKRIYIPPSVSFIDSEIFEGTDGTTVYGEPGSYAEEYAEEYGYPFRNGDLPSEDSN